MNKTQTIICAIPSKSPIKVGTTTLTELFSRGLSIEKRLQKGANLQEERTRYCLVCSRIEAAAAILVAKNSSEIYWERLSAKYLEALAAVIQQSPDSAQTHRIGAGFFPAGSAGAQEKAFRNLAQKAGVANQTDVKKRLSFLKKANRRNMHVVEIEDGFSIKAVSAPEPGLLKTLFGSPQKQESEEEEDPQVYEQQFASQSVPDEVTQTEGKTYLEIAREKVLTITGGRGGVQALNFSNLRNDIIAKLLHEFVYGETGNLDKPTEIKVVYDDGSEARPFPLACLKQQSGRKMKTVREQPPIKAGLISARHPEMDATVDMYWYRNQEISQARTGAETDEIAYRKSKEILEQSRGEGAYYIHLYQTGFEPPLVAFYRALVEELLHRRKSGPQLEIVPFFFKGRGGYEQGKPWN